MTSLERIEQASPDELARLLHTAIRWLRDEWFSTSLDDPALLQLAAAMGATDRQQMAQLGTPYLRERLDLLAELVDDVTQSLRNPPAGAREASGRWSTVYRRGLALVVDLYEQAAVRNVQVRDVCERAGWVIEPPGLLLSETTEDAITILYEGLQRAAGLLEAAARTHGSRLPAGTELLEHEFAHTRSDDDRLTDAYRRAWGPAQPRGRTRLADADAVSPQPGRADTADASSWPAPPLVANRDNTPRPPVTYTVQDSPNMADGCWSG